MKKTTYKSIIINSLPLILLLLISNLFLRCNSDKPSNEIIDSDQSEYDTLLKYKVTNLDTLINDSCSILIESFNALDSNSLIIHNGTWDTIYDLIKAQDNYSINSYEHYTVSWSTPDFIALRVGCGTTCFDDILIPLFSGGKPQRYYLTYAPDMGSVCLEPTILVYLGEPDTSGEFPYYIVRNLITGYTDSIKPDRSFEKRMNPYTDIDTVFASSNRIMLGQFDENGKLIYKVEKKIDLGIPERPIETWYWGNRIEAGKDLLLYRDGVYAAYYSTNYGDVYQYFGRYTKMEDKLILVDTAGVYRSLIDKKSRSLTLNELKKDTLYTFYEDENTYYSNDTLPAIYNEFNWRMTINPPKMEIVAF